MESKLHEFLRIDSLQDQLPRFLPGGAFLPCQPKTPVRGTGCEGEEKQYGDNALQCRFETANLQTAAALCYCTESGKSTSSIRVPGSQAPFFNPRWLRSVTFMVVVIAAPVFMRYCNPMGQVPSLSRAT